jgi:putative membrane protein
MLQWEPLLQGLVATILFTVLGLIFFGITFFLITRLTPFSVKKEIEEDQNVALGIVIGAMIIGVAMIVSASLHG